MPNPAPHLIVMLTYRDRTVPQAAEVFAQCRHAPAEYWGCKEEGLPLPQLPALFAAMKACGKKTAGRLPFISAIQSPASPSPAVPERLQRARPTGVCKVLPAIPDDSWPILRGSG